MHTDTATTKDNTLAMPTASKTSLLAPLFRGSFYHYSDQEESSVRHSLIRTADNPVSALDMLKKNFFLFSIRGFDNFHVYLWILKDYAWSSGNDPMAYVSGVAALSWCGVLAIVAIKDRDVEELYFLVAMFGWLFANFWWMAAETNIVAQDDDESNQQSSYIMEASLCWLLFYFLYLHPQEVFPENPEVTKQYEDAGMVPRFSYFKNWRQYEYVHMLCWLCKDFAWNRGQKELWIIALIPTVLVGVDFIHESYVNNYVVDFAHYSAQLMWVGANAAWSLGELFFPLYDDAISVTDTSDVALHTGRWWASLLLLLAFVPIALLYLVWLPWVLYHALREKQEKEQRLLVAEAAKQHHDIADIHNPAHSLDVANVATQSLGAHESPYKALVAATLSPPANTGATGGKKRGAHDSPPSPAAGEDGEARSVRAIPEAAAEAAARADGTQGEGEGGEGAGKRGEERRLGL